MKKILVVDDEISIIRATKRSLKEHYEIFTASSGKEALDNVDLTGYDIMLCVQIIPSLYSLLLYGNTCITVTVIYLVAP